MATHKGKTQDAQSPLLGANDWKKGMRVEGIISRTFSTMNGMCYEVTLKTPLKIRGNLEKKVSLGGLKGLLMALNASGLESFELDDKIIVECTGTTPTNKGNPRVDFNLIVDRKEEPAF